MGMVATSEEECNLRESMAELLEAETRWGADDPRVALQLRRFGMDLELAGRAQQALPIWLRVLEIELPMLGSRHMDVQMLTKRITAMLDDCGLSEDAIAAYKARLLDAAMISESN